MQVTATHQQGLKHEFTILIPAKELADAQDKRLKELGGAMRLPGFRPGKVPSQVLKQRYGKQVAEETTQKFIQNSTQKLLSERGLRAAMEPKVDIKTADDGRDLEFHLSLEVLPEIPTTDFKEITLERVAIDISDADITEAMERLAKRHRKSEPAKASYKAKTGDAVVIDFKGAIDGKEFPGGSGEALSVEIGEPQYLPGFDAELTGLKAGDQKSFSLSIPTDFSDPELAGKTVDFSVDVKEVRQFEAQPLDDDFAKSLGFDDLAALQAAVRKQVESDYKGASRNLLKRALLDRLDANFDFALPEGMVDLEFQAIWQQVQADRKAGRVDPDDAGKDDLTLQGEYRAIAARRVKLGLVLSEIGRTSNVQLNNEEVGRAVMAQARRFPGQERQVIDYYQKNAQALAQLRAPLYEEKVVDYILELASISERTVSSKEFSQLQAEEGAAS